MTHDRVGHALGDFGAARDGAQLLLSALFGDGYEIVFRQNARAAENGSCDFDRILGQLENQAGRRQGAVREALGELLPGFLGGLNGEG